MGLNTYPYNPFPASTDKLDESHNEQIQEEVEQLSNEITGLDNELNNIDNKIYGDAVTYPYADVITIEDAVPANLADCSVKIEPVQSGSGDPSPTNVRPITGHTEVSVEVTDGDETTKTYAIALGDTIYGGTVDFDSGVMTVDRGFVEFDGSEDESWAKYETGSAGAYAMGIVIDNFNKNIANTSMLLSSYLQTVLTISTWGDYDYFISGGAGTGGISKLVTGIKSITTVADWKTYLSTHNLQVCYPLATPTTIQLTSQQIQLLKGQNTLTASTGDISVTVNGVSGSIGAVQEQVNATDEAMAELAADIAEQLPTAPTTDGAYVLTVTVASGTPTYSWESAE